jgi:membrane protein
MLLGSIGAGIILILLLWIPRALRASSRVKALKREMESFQAEAKRRLEEAKEESKKKSLKRISQAGGTLRLFWEALKKFDIDNGFFLASAITFNFLICLIPMILLLLGLIGTYLLSDQEIFRQVRGYFEIAFPSLDPRITQTLMTIVQDRHIVGILGMGGSIWVSTWVFGSLRMALDVVFEVSKSRGMLRGLLLDFLMVLLAGFFLQASLVLTSLMTFFQNYRFLFFLEASPIVKFLFRYLLPMFFTFSMSFLIYKIIPDRKIPWKRALQAALFFSVLWEVSKNLFAWYLLYLGKTRFSMLYGSLSTLAIFVFWAYYSSSMFLLGGEIVHLLEERGPKTKR